MNANEREKLRERPKTAWLYNECSCDEPVVRRKRFFLAGPQGYPWCARCGYSILKAGHSALLEAEEESGAKKLHRNESTEENRRIWENVDKVAARSPLKDSEPRDAIGEIISALCTRAETSDSIEDAEWLRGLAEKLEKCAAPEPEPEEGEPDKMTDHLMRVAELATHEERIEALEERVERLDNRHFVSCQECNRLWPSDSEQGVKVRNEGRCWACAVQEETRESTPEPDREPEPECTSRYKRGEQAVECELREGHHDKHHSGAFGWFEHEAIRGKPEPERDEGGEDEVLAHRMEAWAKADRVPPPGLLRKVATRLRSRPSEELQEIVHIYQRYKRGDLNPREAVEDMAGLAYTALESLRTTEAERTADTEDSDA